MLSANQVDANTTAEQINAQLVTLTEKYLGNKEYVLSGTNTGYVGAEVSPLAPWGNLANRYYPTVATIPQSGDNILTKAELGYFTPNNVGASVYLAKNLTPYININAIAPGAIYKYIDPTIFNKGRGLTKNDQDDVITHLQNLNWLKATSTGTAYDGQVIDTSTYQKFIPYQSNYETTKTDNNGVITVGNDYEFWTGDKKNIWLTTNKFTEEDWLKYFDIDSRVKSLLISNGKELYSWHSDVYGNQYALYKAVPGSGRTVYNMNNTAGELWVKTVDGTVTPATSALSAIFNKHINEPSIYNQLISNSIKNFEVFFDTLVIELNGYTLFEKITFDYSTVNINNFEVDFTELDYHQNVLTRLLSSLSLTGITVADFAKPYYGGNWYDETNKTFTSCLLLSANVTNSTGVLSGYSNQGLIVPVLYQYDINSPAKRKRIFPTNTTDYNQFLYAQGASAIDPNKEYITYMEPPVITYNKDITSYVINFVGFNKQKFNIITYLTNASVLGRILTDEQSDPIVTGDDNTITAV